MASKKVIPDVKARIDWEELPWFWIVVVISVFLGGISEITSDPIAKAPKVPAVVVSILPEKHKSHKVKFIDDKSVNMIYLDEGIVVGDTVYIKK